jgi:hypothetical protein
MELTRRSVVIVTLLVGVGMLAGCSGKGGKDRSLVYTIGSADEYDRGSVNYSVLNESTELAEYIKNATEGTASSWGSYSKLLQQLRVFERVGSSWVFHYNGEIVEIRAAETA